MQKNQGHQSFNGNKRNKRAKKFKENSKKKSLSNATVMRSGTAHSAFSKEDLEAEVNWESPE